MNNLNDDIYFINEKAEKLIVFLFIAVMFVFMVLNPAHKTFTYDELDWTLKFVDSGSYSGMIRGLLNYGYNLPLYYTILYLIFQTGTYSEIFYMLPSIIFVIAGVIGMYFFGRKNLGRIGGLLCFFITVTSGILVSQGGWKVRPYGMLFCFSVLTLYCFMEKLKEESGRNLMRFCIVLLILMYTHWFGALIAVFYGMADLFFIARKKLSIRSLVPYIIDVCLFVPWLFIMFKTHINTLSDYWANIPDLNSFLSVISYLFSRNKLMVVLFLVSCLFSLWIFIKRREALYGILFGAVIWVFSTVFVYSRFINPDGSLFVKRYFFVILPHLHVIFAAGIYAAVSFIKKPLYRKCFISLFIIIFIVNAVFSYNKALESTVEDENQYRQTADHIMADAGASGRNTLILTSAGREWVNIYLIPETDVIPGNMARGTSLDSMMYYMKDGAVSDDETLSARELQDYDVIYAFELHSKFKDDIRKVFDSAYEKTGEDENCNLVIYRKKQ